jgi:hypothetical protein
VPLRGHTETASPGTTPVNRTPDATSSSLTRYLQIDSLQTLLTGTDIGTGCVLRGPAPRHGWVA